MSDVERLKAWVEREGYSSRSLSKVLLYANDSVAHILAGRRPMRDGFPWRFAGAFGEQAHDEVFTETLAARAARCGVDADYHIAHLAVTSAIQCGVLPHAKTQKCAACDRQARLFHHESYHRHDVLCVVPLCGSCHKYHHSGSKKLTFGIVAMNIGIVRIAISDPA